MKVTRLLVVLVLGLGSALQAAEPCRTQHCGELPPVKGGQIMLVHQPPPPPPVFCPPTEHPNIKFFRIVEKPPVTCCAPPPAPIRVFVLPPPCAPVCKLPEPCVNWFRMVQPPPCVKDMPPLPPLRLTSTTQRVPMQLPDVHVPSIRVVAQPHPCGPVTVDACRGLCGACGNGTPIYRGK